MRGSLTLGHIRNIPIRVHFTLLIIIPYLAYLMAAQFRSVTQLAGVSDQAMTLPPLLWGLLLAVALFACILAHELGHALLALRFGGQVSSITLMLLGGISELRGLPRTPRTEGLVAAAGPLVSLALSGLAWLGYLVIPGPADLRFGLYYLGQINVVIAIFNLLPAFPMDGGRVLRAILAVWWPRPKATRIAANTGSVFAALFILAGLMGGNLMLALIGLFVWTGARAESMAVTREEELRGLSVRDVMSPTYAVVDVTEPVTMAAARMAAAHTTTLPVVENGDLVGVIAAHHVEGLPPQDRAITPTSAVTARDVPRLEADEPLADALERMAGQHAEEAPVLHDGRLVGVLEASDLGRAIRLRKLSVDSERQLAWRRPLIDRPSEA